MRIQVAIPEEHVEADVLNAALESVTRLDEKLLAEKKVPHFEDAVKKHGLRWRPEPPGQEHFDHAATIVPRKWGDCDDIAPYSAATLRHTGEDPDATAVAKRSGPRRWHAVVRRGDGTIEDPSRFAGMGQPVIGIVGAAVPLMCGPAPSSSVVGAYMLRPQIALRPVRGEYQARADLPWNWRERLDEKPSQTDTAITSLHTAPLASTALTGAIEGAIELGLLCGDVEGDHIARLAAISDGCNGMPYHELEGHYGTAHADAAMQVVGAFFTSGVCGAGSTLLISPGEGKQGAARAMTAPGTSDDVKKLALMVHQNAAGKRPTTDTLTGAIMQYLATTQGPVLPNSADEHARLLIADQAAKKLMMDPWFLNQMQSHTVGGLFDFVSKAVGSIGKAVGGAVKAVAPIVAKVAPMIPIVGPAISGAASLAAGIASSSSSRTASPARPASASPAFVPSPRPVSPIVRATAPAARSAAVAPRAPSPVYAPTASQLVPGGVPGSAAIHQGTLLHVVPFV